MRSIDLYRYISFIYELSKKHVFYTNIDASAESFHGPVIYQITWYHFLVNDHDDW